MAEKQRKPAYSSPELIEHGSLEEITATSPNFTTGSDGGLVPNTYVS